MLSFRGVTLCYRQLVGRPKVVLRDLDLQVLPGEVHAIVGRNGAGKTTLVRAILGLLRAERGEVRVLGMDPHRHARGIRGRVGALLDGQRQFAPRWTGREGLEYIGILQGLSGSESRRRASNLLERVGLASTADRRFTTYSRGMRQRLGLAATFMNTPDLLIWDEPSLGLDVEGSRLLRELMEEARQRGVALLLTSHEVGLLEHAVGGLTIIDGGRVIARGSTSEIAARARDAARVRLTLDRPVDELRLPPEVAIHGHTLECPLQLDVLRSVFAAVTDAGHELHHLRSDSTLEESLIRLSREAVS